MAYVLSLRPQSPLKRSFSDNPYPNPCSPFDDTLHAPLTHATLRNGSARSFYSLRDNRAAGRAHADENAPPLASQSLLDLASEKRIYPVTTARVVDEPRKRNCGHDRPPPSFCQPELPSPSDGEDGYKWQHVSESCSEYETADGEGMDLDDDSSDENNTHANNFAETHLFNLYEAIHVPLPTDQPPNDTGSATHEQYHGAPAISQASSQPFRRWMSTLKRRHAQRWKEEIIDLPRSSIDTVNTMSVVSQPLGRIPESIRRANGSLTSSMEYVTAMKSTSITVGSTSIAPRSDAGLPSRVRLANRSSNLSEVRRSLDSHRGALGPVLDESAWLRALQRRKVVEELIASEEGYIADLKVLINDYFMILTALPTLPGHTKSSIQQNLFQILQLHEDLLADLHQVVPHADFTKSANQEALPATKAKHIRFNSADVTPSRLADHRATRRLRHSLEIGRSPECRSRGLATDTETAGNIAKMFNKHMRRFFTYEEYGAHWTTMSQDLMSICKGLHGWQEYERGIEALQKVIASQNNREAGSRKALSFSDLLIKPIQRVCKYPLLFDDLCRHTPVYDDPEAHAELEKALFRLQETIREVNKAKDDPQTRKLIEITWQLQDRLAFQEHKVSKALVFRMLGHVLLCGVLHVAYQTPDRIKGSYMVCVLYRSCLVLATASRFHTPLTVVASIALANASIEDADNGRGMQCHTAPHTWKFVFEHGHRLHEMILTACSSVEEEAWKNQLRERIVYETHDFVEGQSTMQDMFTSITLDLKSIGPVFGHANSLVRRMSVHRAATLGTKTNTNQVIIKNTQAQKFPDSSPPLSPGMVARSQSHLSPNHIPALVPRRAERIRLEHILEDVWTKDALPFPGMSSRRMENQIRASANSVMRKLSMASIASNFSRRSPSLSNTSNSKSDDSSKGRVCKTPHGTVRSHSVAERRPVPAVVDFHSAPAAFLPTDFEVEDPRPSSRHRRLANCTGDAGTAVEKSLQVKPKKVRRLSSHMIGIPRSESARRAVQRTSSHELAAKALRAAPPRVDAETGTENKKMKAGRMKGRETKSGSPCATPSRKFLKSKNRIFNLFR
ncbi:hypothetical protein COCC4DRAFT_82097 [Bipolaris maydis ATCC 48331]|uniref:DH domain-containing protein n=2 Tax=Cochliobolus heterostrophus TaxID=5016 RepID=M2TKS7_COCH5|nr:uncharacterized protein COCC4DRAFT_82097 [Bipolaris maydis ATCC 48331]EMD87104.1 hypothetical protein COCHEDRAFT_1197954 [Bipolaris maydis C5]KAJ5021578.1 hypothetical protein J3E73DRAFT_220025 [Bipolaris maydis]ENI03901.1 hypothetical protein COCC4DRAFT_82097 [Bipolaris maydis ATCC 48331]KAJ5055780.1 hypothetical protein J3E74DRAFT_469106 [Bipolaris maydis]KAJ6192854.1 hypothetical protein J3E72DRAFT_389142 [Bipolaris maydis]